MQLENHRQAMKHSSTEFWNQTAWNPLYKNCPYFSIFGVPILGFQAMKFQPQGSYKNKSFYAGFHCKLQNLQTIGARALIGIFSLDQEESPLGQWASNDNTKRFLDQEIIKWELTILVFRQIFLYSRACFRYLRLKFLQEKVNCNELTRTSIWHWWQREEACYMKWNHIGNNKVSCKKICTILEILQWIYQVLLSVLENKIKLLTSSFYKMSIRLYHEQNTVHAVISIHKWFCMCDHTAKKIYIFPFIFIIFKTPLK